MSQNQTQIPTEFNVQALARAIARQVVLSKIVGDNSPPAMITLPGPDGLPGESMMTTMSALRLAGLAEAWVLLTTPDDEAPRSQEEMDALMPHVLDHVMAIAGQPAYTAVI